MLTRLEIRNYAIIDHLELDFDDGLNIITGETGAGKSILLGALGLILGNRADTKVLYKEDEKCVVEATYDIQEYALKSFFEEHDIDYEQNTVIRRVISPTGKSRAFINDMPTTLQVLKSLNDHLIDLHQQFDTLDIHKVSFQTNTIDAVAGNNEEVEKYKLLYAQYSKTKRILAQLEKQQQEGEKEKEFLEFQYNEIATLNISEGEYKEKEALLTKLSNAEEIKRSTTHISSICIESDSNITDLLVHASNELRPYIHTDDKLEDMYERLSSTVVELQDVGKTAAAYADNIEYDEPTIHELTDRIDNLNRLIRKHNLSDDADLIAFMQDLESRMKTYQDISKDINTTLQEINEQETQLEIMADSISARRKAAIPEFEQQIHDMLVPLSMEHAYIKAELVEHENLVPSGKDEVRFLFSSNKGSKYKLLKDIASGGEISRLTLCIKSLVADAITLPTLIFDEIDTGVSGEVASRMGEIFESLSRKHQVISITHSPQITAKADAHYFVHKVEKEDRTLANIKLLDQEERIQEIAKMLSGNPPSDAAVANAKELLSQ